MNHTILIRQGTLHDGIHREPYTADILVENGKIARIDRCWRRRGCRYIPVLWKPTVIWGWTAMPSDLKVRIIMK